MVRVVDCHAGALGSNPGRSKDLGDSDLPSKGASPFSSMGELTVDLKGVAKLLDGLNVHKAPDLDGLNARVRKECSTQISPNLALIYNESLAQGNVPDDWRHANVSPVFKKGEKYDAANYRPVSLTCICCKTLEHILVSNINRHLALDSILADCQHGFQSRRSCETQLVQFVHDIISNLDGAMNRGGGGGAQADRFDHHGYRKGLRQGPTQEAIIQTRLLWDTRVHPQVVQLMALWAQSTSSFRRSSLNIQSLFYPVYPRGRS